MTERMKILIGYDGSECAEAAIDDLKRAGLPRDAQATVVSVAEIWLPTPRSFGGVETHFKEESPDPFDKADALARQAGERLRSFFHNWVVKTEAIAGSPARVLIEKADEWKPDLIVVGSHGRSGLERLILGSVSQKVLSEADCSVRIARGRKVESQKPVRIVIGVDGSPGSDSAVEAVARRWWPAGSEVLAVTTDFVTPTVTSARMVGPLIQWIEEERERMHLAIARAKEKLVHCGLSFSSLVKAGDPKEFLRAEAEDWKADCIFVGAKSQSRIDRFWLGSVSAAVASRAHCSVEAVRAKEMRRG
ncbi:MAG: universal stress protein [Blastocatellia bacterium]